MMRKAGLLFCLTVLGIAGVYAGSRPAVLEAKEAMADDGTSGSVVGVVSNPINPSSPNSALNWVLVDSMPNAFGPANDNITPLSFDPGTDVLGVIYRGNAAFSAGSGELWYSISHDGGATWRRVSALNAGTPLYLRYPSCAIANPTGGTDTSDVLFVWSAPGLPGGVFGGITYGVDPIGTGTPFAVVANLDSTLASSSAIWTSPAAPDIYWVSSRLATGLPNDSYYWHTTDYVTVNEGYPPTWRDTSTNFVNALGHMNGQATANGSYYAVNAAFDTAVIAFGAGISKTTDGGANWSEWITPRPDWVQATGLPLTTDAYDYFQSDGPGSTVSYLNDMLIDANEMVHFFHVTVDSPWTSTEPRGIVEIVQTSAVPAEATWEAKWIKQNLNLDVPLYYPYPEDASGRLDQTYNAIHASISPDGQVMTLVWLDATSADSLPDIYFSFRNINSPGWSTPENISQTPELAELMLHAAPTLRSNGGNSYTLFLGRTYQVGSPVFSAMSALSPCSFYVAAYTFNAVTSVAERRGVPSDFALRQNYPNPFNPSTTIGFTLPERAVVKLTVYNTLGQKVATVLDGAYEAGSYEVPFSAERLTSGVYYYTINAGSYSATRKMVLLK